MSGNYHDVEIGDVFGKLTVIDYGDHVVDNKGRRRKRFLAQCECGAKLLVKDTTLTMGYRTECDYCAGKKERPAKYC